MVLTLWTPAGFAMKESDHGDMQGPNISRHFATVSVRTSFQQSLVVFWLISITYNNIRQKCLLKWGEKLKCL